MYNYIDNQNNQIEDVYSGYLKSWTYGGTGTNPQPVNCEHTVPQRGALEAQSSTSSKSSPPPARSLTQLPTMRFLLAETNAFDQRIVSKMLSRFGHTVEAVTNFQRVIQSLSNKPFDVLLLDVDLPDMDADKLADLLLQAQHATLATVILSDDLQQQKRNIPQFQHLPWIEKPVSIQKMTEALLLLSDKLPILNASA